MWCGWKMVACDTVGHYCYYTTLLLARHSPPPFDEGNTNGNNKEHNKGTNGHQPRPLYTPPTAAALLGTVCHFYQHNLKCCYLANQVPSQK
mmetsp:Transcript_56544/g.100781  ORF Transcript_56544/g.100781 Transcript_56544/m.100781 type:complete len:91 (-) Transcript_56544:264-536(-)